MTTNIQNMERNDLLSKLWIDFCTVTPSNNSALDARDSIYEAITTRSDIFTLKQSVDLWDAAIDKLDSDSEVRNLAMNRVRAIIEAVKE